MELIAKKEVWQSAGERLKSIQSGSSSKLAVSGITPAIYAETTAKCHLILKKRMPI